MTATSSADTGPPASPSSRSTGGSTGANTALLPKAKVARASGLFVVLVIAALIMTIVAAGLGQLEIAPKEIIGSLLHRLGLDIGPMPSHPRGDATLWNVRFPRIAMAMIVGAALAAAGALMQGVFGNPLAEPAVVGVSVGAAFAASLVIVYQLNFAGEWTIAIFAFCGGLITTILVYVMSRADGRTEVVTLVLTGIALNAICSAGLGLMLFLGDTQAREEIVFWQLGSLNGTRTDYVLVAAPIAAIGLIGAVLLARKLDILSLGDRAARHVGVDVERVRLTAIVLVALLTAAGVAFVGIVAFVGLVVPHVVRMIVGPAHRVLVPASALMGAVLLLGADLVARTAVAGADLPLGMITSFVGGPFFFWLLRHTRRTAGGWS